MAIVQVKTNDEGGVVPRDAAERERAKAVDLGTLPPHLEGTNCGNCSFFSDRGSGIGFCDNKAVQQYVSVRMCCGVWDNPGYVRAANTR